MPKRSIKVIFYIFGADKVLKSLDKSRIDNYNRNVKTQVLAFFVGDGNCNPSNIPHIKEEKMAEKKVAAMVKLQLPAGKATPGPPVGSTLGPHGINIAGFTKEFNEKTASQAGLVIPVVITIYADRSFSFVLKTPPAAVLIKKAIGLDKGSAAPNKTKVGTITRAQIKQIAETKMPDLNCTTIESAMSMIEGAAKSMGVSVVD